MDKVDSTKLQIVREIFDIKKKLRLSKDDENDEKYLLEMENGERAWAPKNKVQDAVEYDIELLAKEVEEKKTLFPYVFPPPIHKKITTTG